MRPSTVTVERISNGYIVMVGPEIKFYQSLEEAGEAVLEGLKDIERIKILNDELSKENPQNGTN